MSGTAYFYTDPVNAECIVTRGQARNYPWHMHARHWIVGAVLSGTVQLTTDVKIQTLSGGQQFFLRPYEPHSLSVAQGSSLLVFCTDTIENFTDGCGVFQELSLHIPLFRKPEKLLARSLTQVRPDNFIPATSSRRNVLSPSGSLVGRAVQAVLSKMLDVPDTFSGLEQMAAYAGYSPWHFLRVFRNLTGMTPHAFQLLCRLRLLRGLLRTDTASAAAAASAGFSDQSHMHKVFKRHHGMTPGQFKQASFRITL